MRERMRTCCRQQRGWVDSIAWRGNSTSNLWSNNLVFVVWSGNFSVWKMIWSCGYFAWMIMMLLQSGKSKNSLMITTQKWFVLFNTLRPRQNGRHFADDIFKCIFLDENVWIPIKISLKFVPKGPINNIPALVQIMAWRRPGDKPLSKPMMVSLPTHICVVRPQWIKSMLCLFQTRLRGNLDWAPPRAQIIFNIHPPPK